MQCHPKNVETLLFAPSERLPKWCLAMQVHLLVPQPLALGRQVRRQAMV